MKHWLGRILANMLLIFITNCQLLPARSDESPPPDSSPTEGTDLERLNHLIATTPPGMRTVRIDDMLLPLDFVKAERDALRSNRGFQRSSVFHSPVRLWTAGQVYYEFSNDITPEHRKAFLDAADEWSTFANVRFIERQSESNYIFITNLPESDAAAGIATVGMVGGMQVFSISSWTRSVLCHELGHTLGLAHEHQRPDRDDYITILTENISQGHENSLVKLATAVVRTPYDFLSVMHYWKGGFSRDPSKLNTIEPKPGYEQFLNLMGNNNDPVLSWHDREGMKISYGSGPPLHPVVTNTRENGPGSLRSALYQCIDQPGTLISFNIPQSDPGFSNGVWTIRPRYKLYSLGENTVLDATTQPGYTTAGHPVVILSGSDAGDNADGLVLSRPGSTVKGLVIQSFGQNGIKLTGSRSVSNRISGCFIGTDPLGTTAVPNLESGILLNAGATMNQIGGGDTASRNIISGNAGNGITITHYSSVSNSVQGNFIGIDSSGAKALGNHQGIEIWDAGNNLIGGKNMGEGNIISGNMGEGIWIYGSNAGNSLIQGNYIGTDSTGSKAVGNKNRGILIQGGVGTSIGTGNSGGANVISGNLKYGIWILGAEASATLVHGNKIGTDVSGRMSLGNLLTGVLIQSSSSNRIGGSLGTSGNVISGNLNQGVWIYSPDSVGNQVLGNYIGTDAAGSASLGNGTDGIVITDAKHNVVGGVSESVRNVISGNRNTGIWIYGSNATGNHIWGNLIGTDISTLIPLGNGQNGILISHSSNNNEIGGLNPGMGNTVAYNGAGPTPYDGIRVDTGMGNAILSNWIFRNGNLGINLGGDGLTTNDPMDADTGPNNFQNHPIVESVVRGDGQLTIKGRLDSEQNRQYWIEFFTNEGCTPGGPGQGLNFVGRTAVVTDATGAATFEATISDLAPNASSLTATATDPSGNTSEFSACTSISPGVVTCSGLEADLSPRSAANGLLTIGDWVQVGRFAAGLDTPSNDCEFQKADCSPSASRGNGIISVSDWVQAGRYAAGLDPAQPVGGTNVP